MQHEIRDQHFLCSTIETCITVVKNHLIACIYIPPNKGIKAKIAMLSEIMDTYVQEYKILHAIDTVVIMGDFNTPYVKDRMQIEQLFRQYQYISHKHEPTHFNGGTLDLCFSNKENTKVFLQALRFTDHYIMSIQIS